MQYNRRLLNSSPVTTQMSTETSGLGAGIPQCRPQAWLAQEGQAGEAREAAPFWFWLYLFPLGGGSRATLLM